MEPAVVITTVAATPTAVVAATTDWQEFPTLWSRLLDQVYACIGRSGGTKQGRNVMLYMDDVPHVEVGVELVAPLEMTEPVVESSLPAGRVALIVHRGPYGALGDAHGSVRAWCAAHGENLAGPRWEIYGDWREDPAQLETEVCYLLD